MFVPLLAEYLVNDLQTESRRRTAWHRLLQRAEPSSAGAAGMRPAGPVAATGPAHSSAALVPAPRSSEGRSEQLTRVG